MSRTNEFIFWIAIAFLIGAMILTAVSVVATL